MFAVIRTGGKQYKVQEGDVLNVELLGEIEAGQSLTFDDVLLVSNGTDAKIGQPKLEGAKVTAELVDQIKGDKVFAFQFKRRKGYRRKVGHRQKFHQVKIQAITA